MLCRGGVFEEGSRAEGSKAQGSLQMRIQTPPEDKPLKVFQWGLESLAPDQSPEGRRQLGIKTSLLPSALEPSAFLGQSISRGTSLVGGGKAASKAASSSALNFKFRAA